MNKYDYMELIRRYRRQIAGLKESYKDTKNMYEAAKKEALALAEENEHLKIRIRLLKGEQG